MNRSDGKVAITATRLVGGVVNITNTKARMEGTSPARYSVTIALISDAQEIFDIINDAYSVETGDTGVSFKREQRLVDPLEEQMIQGYTNQTILKCVDNETGCISGILSYEFRGEMLYFGPFAVPSKEKGKGIGKILLKELKRIGIESGKKFFQIRVVNHRSDLFPMYYKWGFVKVGEEPYPHPERLTRPSYFEVLNLDIEQLPV